MLKRYPDYGKATPDYVAGIVGIFASYEPTVQAMLADPKAGVPCHCEFLPTIAAVVKLAGEFEVMLADKRERDEAAKKRAQSRAEPMTRHGEFVPFPKLWDAMAHDRSLLHGHRFDALFSASRALAASGFDAARRVLEAGRTGGKSPVREIQSSHELETPARPASAALRELMGME